MLLLSTLSSQKIVRVLCFNKGIIMEEKSNYCPCVYLKQNKRNLVFLASERFSFIYMYLYMCIYIYIYMYILYVHTHTDSALTLLLLVSCHLEVLMEDSVQNTKRLIRWAFTDWAFN